MIFKTKHPLYYFQMSIVFHNNICLQLFLQLDEVSVHIAMQLF